jgi:uncharacterized protein YbjT (DUF2867 family)
MSNLSVPERVLVIGGAGRTGRHVVDKLRSRGATVSVLSRHPRALPEDTVAIIGDITDPESVAKAVREVDAAVIVVESTLAEDATSNAPSSVHYEGTMHVVDAAQARGGHVVMVSQIYITRPEMLPEARNVIAARRRAEPVLRESELPYTIVRPSWLTDDPGGQSAIRLEQGDTGDGSVSREDVAETVVQTLGHAEARGKTFELYAEPGAPPRDWASLFSGLSPDDSPPAREG